MLCQKFSLRQSLFVQFNIGLPLKAETFVGIGFPHA